MIFDSFKNIFKKQLPLKPKEDVINFVHNPISINYINQNSSNPVFSENDYLEFHNQFLNNNFFLNEKNKSVLEKIHEDLSFVFELLKPLRNQYVDFELILTGGAVRDFLLGKSDMIKDLDISINISSIFKQRVAFCQFNKQSDVICHLLKEANISFDKLSETKNNFERVGLYNQLHQLLEEVVEIKGKHFPIQLLSNHNSHDLIQNFDIDICKVGLRIFCDHNSFKNTTFPENINEYVSRLEYQENFLSHTLAKKISYHNEGKKEAQIKHELVHHLTRVIDKYPEFSLDIYSPNFENYQFTKEWFDKVISFTKLTRESNNKEHKLIKKQKI